MFEEVVGLFVPVMNGIWIVACEEVIVCFGYSEADWAVISDLSCCAWVAVCWQPSVNKLSDRLFVEAIRICKGFGVVLPIDVIDGGFVPFVFLFHVFSEVGRCCCVRELVLCIIGDFEFVDE